MKRNVLSKGLAIALLVAAGTAGAATSSNAGPTTDAALERQIRHEILMYPRYSIWDDISFRVRNGQVELMGAVNQPFKKADIARIVQRVPGVTSVTDQVRVLPLSNFDDQLRLQVARAIYGHPALNRYALQAVGPIHIIVENGRVTLTGVVNNDMEKNIAGIRAGTAGLSFGPVVNNLRVENPARKG
jgi:hyperosmotically inducible periplasmic protein